MPYVSDHHRRYVICWASIGAVISCMSIATVNAGMPAVLPSGWTAENSAEFGHEPGELSGSIAAVRFQAISFFVVLFLLTALLIKWIWNAARRDVPSLPRLSYGRALGLLTLNGFMFVVVLTMISGARELMTPGAWRKQGWTYRLANAPVDAASSSRAARQQGLEQLRTVLWQFAALNNGRLPTSVEASIPQSAWKIPCYPGLRFMTAGGDYRAEEAGRLFVFEPDVDGSERLVLLSNGLIGTMSTDQIRQMLSADAASGSDVLEATGQLGDED